MAYSSNSSNQSKSSMDGLQPSQIIALATGIVFTLVGLVGFAVTGVDDFATANTGDSLLGFELNPLHNIVHLAIGLGGLAMWRTVNTSRTYGWLLMGGYGAAFIYGLFVVNSTSAANFLSLNGPDNGLHLVAAAIGLATALMPATNQSTSTSSTRGTGSAI